MPLPLAPRVGAPLALRVAAPAARPHLPALAASAGLALLRSGVTLALPWPLAVAVDHAISRRPLALLPGVAPLVLLVLAAAALVLLTLVVGLLDLAVTWCGDGAAERIGATLRKSVFDRSMALSPRWHDRMRSGEVVSRLTADVGRLLDGIVAATVSALPDTVMVVTVLAVLVAIDPELALVGLAVVPLLAVLAVRQRGRVRAVQRAARSASGRLATVTGDLIRNVRAVQAFGRHTRATALFGAHNRTQLHADLRTIDVEARWHPM
ncbi:MAG TPA: ABC transporter transmembrane domain-containing protein, partial [Pseudonocardiaceae bacterium]|nr:ABC transporter transmembrane domain-containing protein [Pseudonocardiaceae bacterium]